MRWLDLISVYLAITSCDQVLYRKLRYNLFVPFREVEVSQQKKEVPEQMMHCTVLSQSVG